MKRFPFLLLTFLCILAVFHTAQAQCNMTLQATTTPVRCSGEHNGALDLTIDGGTDPFIIQWSNGSNQEDLENLAAGTYIVSVTDALGCFATLSRNFINPTVIQHTIVELCDGDIYKPSLNYQVSGGISPYQFEWSSGEDIPKIYVANNIATYTATVTDAHGCTASKQIEAGYPDARAGTNQALHCTDLSATLNGSTSLLRPGTSIEWSTSGSGLILSGEHTFTPAVGKSGNYYLYLFDPVTQCASVDDVDVTFDIGRPTISFLPTTSITCIEPTVTLHGVATGMGAISYQWSTTNGSFLSGVYSQNPVVDQEGVYTLIATDSQNGCTKGRSTTVNDQSGSPILLLTASQYWVPCGGGPVTLSAFIIDGTFVWTGPNGWTSTSDNPVINQPGTYYLTLQNISGCVFTDSITIQEEAPMPFGDLSYGHASCALGPVGYVHITPTFGTAPYTYLWSNGATTKNIDNLAYGSYFVVVTDAVGCKFKEGITVGLTDRTMTLSHVDTPVKCFGVPDGAINLSVANGVAPYTYAWEGPPGFSSTVEDPSNLTPGNYRVTVTDATGCMEVTATTIPAPNKALFIPQVDVVVSDAMCNAGTGGAVDLYALGGMPPYTYDWSNDGAENPDNDPEDLSGTAAGAYTLTVTDANGCSLVTGNFIISQPPSLDITANVTNTPCGGSGNEGAIDISVTGGAPPYAYHWEGGETTEDIAAITAGTYSVTVTDSNGCTGTYSTSIVQGSTILTSDFTTIPASCETGSADGAISLNALPPAAQAPLNFIWQGPAGFSATTQNITGLQAGDYALLLSDATGCPFAATVTVNKIPGNLNLTFSPATITCTNAVIALTVDGGILPYTFVWSDGSTAQNLTATIAGTYTVTVTDASGCSKTAGTTLTQSVSMNLTGSTVDATCNGHNDGAIQLTVSGGTPAYSYLWSNNTTLQNATGLSAGNYCVTVTDSNGCTQIRCATVNQPVTFTTNLATASPICATGTDGSITVEAHDAGLPPYAWNLDGTSSQNGVSVTATFHIPGLPAGNYCVTLTNSTGCTATACTIITAPAAITAGISELSNTCNSAALTANITGGVAPLSYSWEGPIPITADTAQTIIAPVSGFYQLSVLDANGCEAFANTVVALANGGNCGYIQGFVREDVNNNCNASLIEPGLAGWLVRAEGADTLYGVTDANGQYFLGVPTGAYTMSVIMPNNLWQVCPGMPHVTVNMANDTAFGGDFPVQEIIECPNLSISIGTNRLRRCFSDNYYQVVYCNEGTVLAQNAYVEVTFDPFINFIDASIPSEILGNHTIKFPVGDLDAGECGSFSIQVAVNCSAALSQTHCTEARIYPNTLCNTDPLWSGASIDVRSRCDTDSLLFVVKNIGTGQLTHVVDYIVVEDAVMVREAAVPLLNSGDSIIVALPANGSTWRLEVGQEAHHPFPQPVALSVEGCTTSGVFSTGFINQFYLSDGAPSVDVDCTANIGSYDPNDKIGIPIGYGAAHYIEPGTEIEYKIRFQNAGTDTAFTVHIIDTLSGWLNPATVRFGASSHPYQYDLTGEGIVHFMFENIMLPDSNINLEGSQGYAKFTVKPYDNAPLESVIENTAAIYFDFNEPVFTNTTVHKLGEHFVHVGTWQPQVPEARVTASPNPFSEETTLEVKGLKENTSLQLQIFDYQGIEIKRMKSDDAVFHLRKGDWPAGIYFFKIMQHGKIVGNGKLMAQ